MGSAPSNEQAVLTPTASPSQKSNQLKGIRNKQNEVSIDVIQVSNIALAIKHNEHIVNLQLTLSCRNLPPSKAFEEMHSVVALFKLGGGQQMYLGRTQQVIRQLSPKYMDSFIVPSSADRQQQIQFRIYDFNNPSSQQLRDQYLIGQARATLDGMIDTQSNQLPVVLTDPNHKEKTLLKVSCSQYDGGNIKYQIELEVKDFTGRLEMYYVIEVLKESQWTPIDRSAPIQIKKKINFQKKKIAANKFPGEEAARVRIRLIDETKSSEQIGCTEQLILMNLVGQQQRSISQRVYKNGFFVGNIVVVRWKKVNRDSFLTYIVNGARLHLILGIDFTNSNFKTSEPLHHPDQNKNLYIAAIRQIVGMLQYFDYYNQIALYGFGAKLPPYYKCVGQCFALNGNYFHPLMTGGVDQIIRLYKQTLAKIQPHGPSKISEIINMAIQFAQAEYQSTNYYVLILLTDGQIDDYSDTVDKIIQASSLPLSIVIVGLGDGDFQQIQKLDQDGERLKSDKLKLESQRDMIDFINFKEYLCEERSALTQTNLARKTFAELPNQFVDYMQRKNIKPNKEKKGLKAAKAQFISQKIKQYKKGNAEVPVIPEVEFLRDQKKKLRRDLLALGLGIDDSEALQKNLLLPMNDINYFIQLYSAGKPAIKKEKEKAQSQIVNYQQEKKFEQYLQKNEQFINKRIQNELRKRQINQFGKKKRLLDRPIELPKKQKKILKHPCLKCNEKEIAIVHGSCGHLAVCQNCCTKICFLCKQSSQQLINIKRLQH